MRNRLNYRKRVVENRRVAIFKFKLPTIKIALSNGGFAVIDIAYFALLSKYTWCRNSDGYAVARIDGPVQKMHRVIMNPSTDLIVDHINDNKLDNRRSNLQIITRRQNTLKSKAQRLLNILRYEGVIVQTGL